MHRRRKEYFGFFCISCGLIQITRNVYTFLCSFYADEGRKTPGRGCAPGFWGSGSVTEVRRMNKTLVHPRRFQRIVPAYAAYPSSAPQGWGEKRSRAVTLHLFATPGFSPTQTKSNLQCKLVFCLRCGPSGLLTTVSRFSLSRCELGVRPGRFRSDSGWSPGRHAALRSPSLRSKLPCAPILRASA